MFCVNGSCFQCRCEKKIGKLAFAESKLTRVNFRNIETIDENAFDICSELTEIVFNAHVETIDGTAFFGCSLSKGWKASLKEKFNITVL